MDTATLAKTARSEFDELKEHLHVLREDVAALASTTTKIAVGQAKKQLHYAGDLAGNVGESAAKYRDRVSDTVKEHPLAAIGIAAIAGLIIASMNRR